MPWLCFTKQSYCKISCVLVSGKTDWEICLVLGLWTEITASAQSSEQLEFTRRQVRTFLLDPCFETSSGEACPSLTVWEHHLNISSRYPKLVFYDSPAIPWDTRPAQFLVLTQVAQLGVKTHVQITTLPCSGPASLCTCGSAAGDDSTAQEMQNLTNISFCAGRKWCWISHTVP